MAFARQVHDALANLFDAVALQTHPLVRYVGAEHRGLVTPVAAGRALRQCLLNAIGALRPPAEKRGDVKADRAYRILQLRYVEALDPTAVQRKLGISRSLYFQDHKRALDAVVSLLAEQWKVAPGVAAGAGGAAPARPAVPALPAAPLPQPVTSFVGREREVAELTRLLASAQLPGAEPERSRPRLVTLLGPAGAGKTRLALEVARSLVETAACPTRFVELAPVSDPVFVLPSIAGALGVRETPGQEPADALKEHLREQPPVLVLDNFEQVLDAAPLVGELLRDVPGLRVLVTSRAALRIYGEHEYPLPALPLPDPSPSPSSEQLARNEAVRLFVDRARAVKPEFAVTDENAGVVAEIVRRLDGLPLVIELAAARLRLMAPPELLARLDRRLTLLTAGARDLPVRQQTLRDALAWSYDLLSPAEQTLFRRIGVFAGGCTLEAVVAVVDGAPPPGAPPEREAPGDADTDAGLLDALESLASKSLLRQDEPAGGQPRFAMLETIREYAVEQLRQAGELEAYRRRHAAYYLAVAERAERMLTGPEQTRWQAHLGAEYRNLRAALRWALDAHEPETGLRIAGALRQFWLAHGHWSEGLRWLLDLLALPQPPQTAVRAKALDRAGALACLQGDYLLGRSLYEQSLAIWRTLGDANGIAASLTGLGNAATALGDYAAARTLHAEVLERRRAAGDALGTAQTLAQLGIVLYHGGDDDAAAPLLEESLALRRSLGDRAGIAHALNGLGTVARCRGSYEQARGYYEECLQVCRHLGLKVGIATVLYNLGVMALSERGAVPVAARYLRESLLLYDGLEGRRGVALCLQFVAAAAAEAEPRRAARLWAAGEALAASTGVRHPPADDALLRRAVDLIGAGLPETDVRAALAAGRALSARQAVRDALETLDLLDGAAAAHSGRPAQAP